MLRLATKCAPGAKSLEQAYHAGFRYVELWLDPALLADWQGALQEVSPFQGFALHFPNRLDLSNSVLTDCVALSRHLASRCLILHQPHYDRYQRSLLAQEPQLQLAVENGKLNQEGFRSWAESNPGLALDVEHLWKFTLEDSPLPKLLESLAGFLGRYHGKLRHVHLPGYWPGFAEHRPMYCAREMIFPVLSLLAKAGFAGLVVSEVDCQHQNPEELRMDVLLVDCWRQAQSPRREGLA